MNASQIRELKRINEAALKNCPKDGTSVRLIGFVLTVGMAIVGLVTIAVTCMASN